MTYATACGVADTAAFVIANLINLGMVAIFLVRTRGHHQLERRIGLGQIALVLPLAVIVAFNAANDRAWWTVILPLLLIAFLLVELLLDYVLKLNFRQTHLLGPYLLLYYAALMGMIGYAFLTSERLGFVTLVTYFAQLAATAYSYGKVGHGTSPPDSPALDGGPR